MNNYKFRGKTTEHGEWVYGFYIEGLSSYTGDIKYCIVQKDENIGDYTEFTNILPETVGQWTGLLDKNGKEIYEGDIIKKRTSISLVSNDFFYDACDFLYKGFFLEKIKSAYGYCLEFDKTNPEYEIIGNKIDNPELLEGK